MLVRSSGGSTNCPIQQSSFAWNTAFRRHFYLDSSRKLENPYAIQESEESVAYDDGLSRVMLKSRYDTLEHMAPRGMIP